MHGPPSSLTIPPDLWRAMLDHLRNALPNEGCGLFACPESDGPDVRVTRHYPGSNLLASPRRFEMEPAEIVSAFVSMREHGLRIAAIYHSHPADPPTLSRIDLRNANYPDAALIVVSFRDADPVAAAWQVPAWKAAKPRQIPIVIDRC